MVNSSHGCFFVALPPSDCWRNRDIHGFCGVCDGLFVYLRHDPLTPKPNGSNVVAPWVEEVKLY